MRAEDYLWSVKDQERQIRERLDRDIATLDAALQATRELSALDGNPNFRAFVAKLQAIHDESLRRLRDHAGPDHELRLAQGRCQGLRDVLVLCTNTKTRAEELARKLKAAQDARANTVRPDGSVVPQGILP